MSGSNRVLEEAEAMYAQLTTVYPKDVRFLRKYAEILSKQRKSAQADKAWERLHGLLLASGERQAAAELEQQHPWLASQPAADEPAAEAGFLAGLESGLLGRLIMRLKRKKLAEGDYLFRKGDAGDAMYIVISGSLIAKVDDVETGKPIVLNHLRRGDVVGELAVLRESVRSADVVASEPVELLELSRKSLENIARGKKDLMERLNRDADIRHRVTQISRNRLLARLPLKERMRLANQAKEVKVRPGQRICEGGRLIEHVYLVTRGVADVIYENHRGESHWLHDLEAGDLLGDLAILGEASHPCDVVAATDMRLLSLDLHVIRDIAGAYPSFRHQLERLIETTMTTAMAKVERIRRVRELD